MLGTFLDKLGGFFDRRFIVAYVIPTLVVLGLVIGISQILFGPQVTLKWWSQLGGQEQILLGVGVLLAIILLAYIFEMLTAPVVRLFEGYWPEGHLTQLAISRQQKKKERCRRTIKRRELTLKQDELIAKQKSLVDDEQKVLIDEQLAFIEEQKELEERRAHAAWYYSFPRDDELLKPTRLGNVLAAAEEYSYQVYRLDAITWWPRLATLLPEAFRIQVDTALTPMLTALNLSTIFTLLATTGGGILLTYHQWFSCGLIFLTGLVLARACYLAAINQAAVYGKLVRVAFDLYRHEILKHMHMPVPDNLVGERVFWELLTNWHYYYIVPWESKSDLPEPDNPFYYDTHYKSIGLEQQEVILTFRGFPNLAVKEETENKS